MSYYQIVGFGAHTHGLFRFNIQRLCEIVYSALSVSEAKGKNIEMVLGMLNTGCSYLLVTEEQMDQIIRYAGTQVDSRRLDHPQPAASYASLSPISFSSSGELYAKAKTFTQKSKPGKLSRGKDISQANKIFDQDNPARPSFERQRVLYKAIQGTIDFDKFALPEMYWLASTSLVALTFQTWNADSIEQRRTNPKILDLGLTSVPCMAFRESNYEGQVSHSVHIKIEEHRELRNGGKDIAPFKYGSSEMVSKNALGKRLNEFFAAINSERAFLLVYDAKQTCNALRMLGVDVSGYKVDIHSLLTKRDIVRPGEFKMHDPHRHQHMNSSDDRHPRSYSLGEASRNFFDDPRRRSRSPLRHPEPYLQRPRSPPPQRNGLKEEGSFSSDDEDEEIQRSAEVYIIDVHALFLALSRLNPGELKSLPDLASRLGIPVDQTMSCAGNGCHLLISSWQQMASGRTIDEQHEERWLQRLVANESFSGKGDGNNTGFDHGESAQPGANSDEEVDPNDIVVPPATDFMRSQVFTGDFRPPADDYDTDDSDY
ncbi:hypothetical protein M0805_007178 [Coniferiporia weirii]|nr:hypothetical protein M0805_007178 [Coniferiporia weirii]